MSTFQLYYIVHTALRIAEDITKKKFSMRPEYEIIGDESSGRVDYAIKVRLVFFYHSSSMALDPMLNYAKYKLIGIR